MNNLVKLAVGMIIGSVVFGIVLALLLYFTQQLSFINSQHREIIKNTLIGFDAVLGIGGIAILIIDWLSNRNGNEI